MIVLPSALQDINDIVRLARHKQIVVFLDYDGTLTPIVTHPEDAHLSNSMRDILGVLADNGLVAVVSGRDLEDVRGRVGLEQLYYAGSHGFEISGPGGFHAIYAPAKTFLGALDQAEGALRDGLGHLDGAQVERKKFAIAIHYRRVDETHIATVADVVDAVQSDHPTLRKTGGKKVFELRPDLDWHKGTALFWLLETMQVDLDRILPFYIGDDLTDEDAFQALRDIGIGIIVSDEADRHTAARYALSDTDAVGIFLETLSLTAKPLEAD